MNAQAQNSSQLLVHNARILTLDARLPQARAMLVDDSCVQWLSTDGHPDSPRNTEKIDCDGAFVLPGFVDAHCHPITLGWWLAGVDCGPNAARSIPELTRILRDAASDDDFSGWLCGYGYDELLLREHRHPSRRDLDEVSSTRPIRLIHSSGHAEVLNTIALRDVGITAATDEPPGATIDRDPRTGEPTGLLFEMEWWVSGKIPADSHPSPGAAARRASSALLAAGVTSVVDAGHRNTARQIERYAGWQAAEVFAPRTVVMLAPGVDRSDLPETNRVTAGVTKLMLATSGGSPNYDADEIAEITLQSVADGSPGIAIHAIEAGTIRTVCEALIDPAIPGFIRRVEHASEATQSAINALKRSGLTVVTQPGFIWGRGERYLSAATESGVNVTDLYPLSALQEAGLPLAAGSDSPYGPHEPLLAIASAVDRLTESGKVLGLGQALGSADSLRLYGPGAAKASGLSGVAGCLAPGMPADFVILDADPTSASGQQLREMEVLETWIDGNRIWSRD